MQVTNKSQTAFLLHALHSDISSHSSLTSRSFETTTTTTMPFEMIFRFTLYDSRGDSSVTNRRSTTVSGSGVWYWDTSSWVDIVNSRCTLKQQVGSGRGHAMRPWWYCQHPLEAGNQKCRLCLCLPASHSMEGALLGNGAHFLLWGWESIWQ